MNRQEFEQGLEAYKRQEFNLSCLDRIAEYILRGIQSSDGISEEEAKDRSRYAYTLLELTPNKNTIVAELMFNKTLERIPELIEKISIEESRVRLSNQN
ncbi:hypothetical protein J4466_04360 [Candidatus Pacearchaeota archaeon]|nr:hypothetical protein [Candidatus Pacearchaeota archaeon]